MGIAAVRGLQNDHHHDCVYCGTATAKNREVAQMELFGLLLVLIGLGVMYLSRQSEGVSGAFFFLLGLILLCMGVYLLFFEDGEAIARWISFLGN